MATILGDKRLNQNRIEEIREQAKQWALLHGVQMRPQDQASSTSACEYAPMTLFPSMVPAEILIEAKNLQPHYNRLMHHVAHDHEFLQKALKNVIDVDEFTERLWRIYSTVRNEGFAQPFSLGLFRNDYMMDVKNSCCLVKGVPSQVNLKQIEFNTIAASFGGLASGIWKVHRYTMQLAGLNCADKQIPENCPADGLAEGLVRAWKLYNNKRAIILCVNQEAERNTMDQKWIEKCVFNKNKKIRFIYMTLTEAWKTAQLSDDKALLVDGQEIAVVYYRNGYSPDNYTSEKHWDLRLRIERSRAIKCPSVHYQLAGCKKIQQELAAPGVLERYIKDLYIVNRIRDTFAGQYSIDTGPDGDKAIAMAMENPQKFVLKPQREGGGNNLYGDDIKDHLEKIKNTEERNAYILMERIFPWPQRNYLMKVGREFKLSDVISEMGIYGVFLGSESEEKENSVVGHLLRTKHSQDNEGGIVAGFATIDSPFIFGYD